MARRQDPWESDPIVSGPAPAAQPVQQPQASTRGQVTRDPDGREYIVTRQEYVPAPTEQEQTQWLNQGYRQDPHTGSWYQVTGTYTDQDLAAQGAQVATQAQIDERLAAQFEADRVRAAELGALQSDPLSAYASAATEQLPYVDEAAAGLTALLTGTPYEDVRRLQTDLQQYDRENHPIARNAGGLSGFGATLATPGGSYIRGAEGAAQVGRAAGVGAVTGALYGSGAAQDGYANRLRGGVIGALGGGTLGAGLQAGGNYAARISGISQANRPVRPPTPIQQRVADFDQVGVDPTLAGVGGPVSQRTAQTLSGNVMTGGPVVQGAQRAREQTVAAVDDIAGRYGSAEGRDTAGGVIRRGAQAGAERFRQQGSDLYAPINQLEQGNTTPIPLTNATRAMQENLSVFQTPALRDWFTRNATDLTDINRALQQSGGQTTFAEARQLRSIVGRMLDDPEVFRSQSQAGLNRMYGALSDDITAGARQLGGEDAAQALSRADTYYAAANTRANDTLRRFYDVDTDATAFNRLAAAARTTGNRSSWQDLRRLRDSVTPEEWGDIGSGVIRTLGQRGDDFSPAQFATEWEKLTPQARRILFGGSGREEMFSDLNALARVARTQRDAGRFYNASESGNVAGNLGMAGALGAAATRAFAGDPLPLIAVVGGGTIGNGLSRLLTSPGVARWAAGSPRTAVQEAERLARRNEAFAQWWSVNRDAVQRAVAQNDNSALLPAQAAAEEERAQ